MARYAAQVILAHGVAPTVQLRQQVPPQPFARTGGLFGRWRGSASRQPEVVAEGWPVTQRIPSVYILDQDYSQMGLVLTAEGELMQYAHRVGPYRHSEYDTVAHEPAGPYSVEQHELLGGDPHAGSDVAWHWHGDDESLQYELAELVARLVPGQESEK